jgi:lysophospholipase L1-like esterase
MLRLLFLLSLVIAITSPLSAATAPSFHARAEAGEALTVVFFGASLTWGANATDPQRFSYRADVARRLAARYPKAHFTAVDAAIGGTGSQLGVFRVERDVLAFKPDLVFLDFSANDDITHDDGETLASYEAILRRLVDAGAVVVPVLFPFRWNIEGMELPVMKRRTAHLALAAAYGCAAGDAIVLAKERVAAGTTTLAALWPYDAVHPGNAGYVLFADAAWQAYEQAVAQAPANTAPAHMVHAETYRNAVRVRLSALGAPPAGWKVDHPNLTSAFYDMLMSRWLDDETIATRADAAAAQPAPISVRFHGAMALLFGESTERSGAYRVLIDGQPVQREVDKKKVDQLDGARMGRPCHGNAHLVEVLATGLDPAIEHTLVIEPRLEAGQELRLESLCVAGPGAAVSR